MISARRDRFRPPGSAQWTDPAAVREAVAAPAIGSGPVPIGQAVTGLPDGAGRETRWRFPLSGNGGQVRTGRCAGIGPRAAGDGPAPGGNLAAGPEVRTGPEKPRTTTGENPVAAGRSRRGANSAPGRRPAPAHAAYSGGEQ